MGEMMQADNITNPFVDYNADKESRNESIPKFKRTKLVQVRVSEEALTQLRTLADKHTGNPKHIDMLLERIGLLTLQVTPPTPATSDDGTTTDQCRQSGYEDGYLGNSHYFLAPPPVMY